MINSQINKNCQNEDLLLKIQCASSRHFNFAQNEYVRYNALALSVKKEVFEDI